MNIILLGPPGTGKGTQAKKVSGYFKIPIISIGDLIRDEIIKKTEFGLIAKEYVDRGELVEDREAIKFVNQILKRYDKGFILDGYPRNINQANSIGVDIDKVIYIESSRENIIKRLMGRARKQKRSDDEIRIIENRLKIFDEETKPLLDYYKEKVVRIDGDRTIKEVFNEIKSKLNSKPLC